MIADALNSVSEGVCSVIGPVTPDNFARYCPRFIDGFFTTIELLAIASVLGLIVAVPMALARVSENRLLSIPAYIYIYVFRGTPLLVQLFLFYFGLAQFEAIQNSFIWPVLRDGWWVAVIVLTINTSAYVAEILRGGILGVPNGEVEAARACGMPASTRYRRVILPQAFRIAWPAYGNEVILLMKGTALASTITVLDLMGQSRTIFSRNYDLMNFVYAAVLYLILSGLLTWSFRRFEKRINRHTGPRKTNASSRKPGTARAGAAA